MTDEEADRAHDVYMDVTAAITALVNDLTGDLTPEQDTYVREMLHDNQHYWRD